MSNPNLIEKVSFWKNIEFLMTLRGVQPISYILSSLEIENKQLEHYVRFLNEIGLSFVLSSTHLENTMAEPGDDEVKIKFEFSLLEWLQFQAHFPYISKAKSKPFYEGLSDKLSSVEEEYKEHDLFSAVENLEKSIISVEGQIKIVPDSIVDHTISQLENAIANSYLVSVTTAKKKLILYPRKIVYCESSLALIAEAVSDGSLSYLSMDEVLSVEPEDSHWSPLYASFEVDDFISSIRLISENTMRLVLKIQSQENFEAQLPYQFFENPYLVTNKDGQLIWAATIEPTDEIYSWVFQLGQDVEILDPVQFKKGYLEFCERKLKKVA